MGRSREERKRRETRRVWAERTGWQRDRERSGRRRHAGTAGQGRQRRGRTEGGGRASVGMETCSQSQRRTGLSWGQSTRRAEQGGRPLRPSPWGSQLAPSQAPPGHPSSSQEALKSQVSWAQGQHLRCPPNRQTKSRELTLRTHSLSRPLKPREPSMALTCRDAHHPRGQGLRRQPPSGPLLGRPILSLQEARI